jgi:SAM-dependent methyltransferase
MTQPHASWASIYDLVYEQSFGEFYNALTYATIEQIKESVQPPARIVDFGAGTGRLSIPLSECGYDVHAVEPCKKMIKQLSQKPGGTSVTVFNGRMQDFQTDTPFDMAICVFTVLLYLLDETSLKKSLQAASNALRPGGLMLIDIPSKTIFRHFQRSTPIMHRQVTVSPAYDDVYWYEEETTLSQDGQTTSYADRFQIRYWHIEFVLRILSEYGFSISKDMSIEFAGTGSQYYLLKKRGKHRTIRFKGRTYHTLKIR